MPWLVLAFCAGATVVHFLAVLPTLVGLLAIAMAGILVWRRWPVIAAMLLGLAWTAFGARQIVAEDWPCTRDREVIDLLGVVTAPATKRGYKASRRQRFALHRTPSRRARATSPQ